MRNQITLLAALVLVAFLSARAEAELLYATNGNFLIRFDSATPSAVNAVQVTGMQPGEQVAGIDVRPATQTLYGLGTQSRLYTINPLTGAATQVGSAGSFTLQGGLFGVDFNPVVDLVRIVSETEQNLRVNPNNASLVATDSPLNPPGSIVGAAYDRNFPGTPLTTLYGIDQQSGNLVTVGGINGTPSPNTGQVNVIGSLGVGSGIGDLGFDISGSTGNAYAAITIGGQYRLYTINKTTGAATLVGPIGSGAIAYNGLTAALIPEPATATVLGAAGAVTFLTQRRRREQRR